MNKTSNKVVVGLAALASAGLASVCCLGPLALTALGLGGVGLAAGLTRYRPVFLVLTAAVLAVGFYLAYRKREQPCADGSCEVRSGSKTMKAALWSVAALALALATFPNWAARVVGAGTAAVPVGAKTLTLKISGMDCAACTVSILEALERVPGVRSASVDFEAGQATVAAGAELDAAAALSAVAAAGYKAEVLEGGGHAKPRS
jgi:copper chaperone CopZ